MGQRKKFWVPIRESKLRPLVRSLMRFDTPWELRIFFFFPRSWQDEKNLSRRTMSYELSDRLRSTWSLCVLVVEHRSAERAEGLRFDSSWGLRIFSRSWQGEKYLSLFLYRAQNLPSLLFLSMKNDLFISRAGNLNANCVCSICSIINPRE